MGRRCGPGGRLPDRLRVPFALHRRRCVSPHPAAPFRPSRRGFLGALAGTALLPAAHGQSAGPPSATPGAAVSVGAGAAGPVASEAQVKAAYLVKFPGFVEWPASAFRDAAAPFVIATVAAEAVLQELRELVAQRRILGRPVSVRPLEEPRPPAELHLLFVGAGARQQGGETIAACRELPVLVVTEAAWGPEAGAMINFVQREGSVRFEAARHAAERAGLKLSARLLAVAERVLDNAP